MVRRDGAEVRRERILDIGKRVLALLHKSGGEIPLGKTVSVFELEVGLTKDKIMEYLRILEDLDRFVLDVENDKIQSLIKEEETSDE